MDTDTNASSATNAADFSATTIVTDPVDPAGGAETPPRPGFRLVRSRSDRMLGGVCGGVAAQLGIDPALLRIGLVALTILGAGAGAVLYVAAWVLAPEED
ncbi:phage shock protein C, PspC [Pseudonocardia dioxanivorans CB1190]|uniref:Phage shock protein C, PspC n=1 Tax=Pseudonocardia dioxanivorans (strain ATCC 55486 / DSM 44775 / JCM 13855 / CB1190) TaxID=675635 RepID=F4D0P8_PSEUX|nr:phage shock protein C, PspC [Pseudonocardia dioxanivorans CB1190]